MAGRVGALKRWILAGLLTALGVAAAYMLLLRPAKAEPHLTLVSATSVIGEGDDAVGVSPEGAILDWLPLSDADSLPRLPLASVPEQGRLSGPALQQARVLGAVPDALRPYVESSYYGESGVDVQLTSGIELHFGDASRAQEKWSAAAAVLSDPSTTALDYVDLHSPRHPAVGGSSHLLPPLE